MSEFPSDADLTRALQILGISKQQWTKAVSLMTSTNADDAAWAKNVIGQYVHAQLLANGGIV